MKNIEWSDKVSVGVKGFDDDHRQIFDAINKLYDAYDAGCDHEIIGYIIIDLLNFADEHFETEERVLRQLNYPYIRGQELAHQSFVKQIIDIKNNYVTYSDRSASLKIASLLRDWLIEHIIGMDKKYQDFLNSRGVR
ncbi:MAG: bacteriohemerythrin [Rhodospirillaceae bacterium]